MNRELMHYHAENRTHTQVKDFSGTELELKNTVQAPAGLKLYGNSVQSAKYRLVKGKSTQEGTPSLNEPYEIIPNITAGTYRIALKDGIYEAAVPYDMHGISETLCDKLFLEENEKVLRLKREYTLFTPSTVYTYAQWSRSGSLAVTFKSSDLVLGSMTKCTHAEGSEILYASTQKDGTYSYIQNSVYLRTTEEPLISTTAKAEAQEWLTQQSEAGTPLRFLCRRKTPLYYTIPLTKVEGSSADDLPFEVYGKNLARAEAVYSGAYGFKMLEEDGRECVRFIDNKYAHYYGVSFKENTRYTASFYAKCKRFDTSKSGNSLVFVFFYADGKFTVNKIASDTDWKKFVITSKAGYTVEKIGLYSCYYGNYVYIDVNTFQLEEGSTATEYEPYDGEPPESLTPSEDYPRRITQSGYTLKCEGADGASSAYIPSGGYAVETSDETRANLDVGGRLYAADVLIYDESSDELSFEKHIDPEKLDFTKALDNQDEAVLDEVLTESIAAGDGEYSLKALKMQQGECTLKALADDEKCGPLLINAKVKVVGS